MLDISRRTLQRHHEHQNFIDPLPYSEISDEELDRIVSTTVQQTTGTTGVQRMWSILLDYGHRVPRHRVRESLRRMDTVGNFDRWAIWIPRTQYFVPGPNALWHMGGKMKLKDYGFVLHSTVDGYSRASEVEIEASSRSRTRLY